MRLQLSPGNAPVAGTPIRLPVALLTSSNHNVKPDSATDSNASFGSLLHPIPCVVISDDGQTLKVGNFAVTSEGCISMRNHLLVNHWMENATPQDKALSAAMITSRRRRLSVFGTHPPSVLFHPEMVTTPHLKSTNMEDPTSPVVYSNDDFPTASLETLSTSSPERAPPPRKLLLNEVMSASSNSNTTNDDTHDH